MDNISIEFSSIIQYSYVQKSQEAEIMSTLNNIYMVEKPETMYSANVLSYLSQQKSYKYYLKENVDHFKLVITIISQDIKKIIDITNIAVLSDETNEKIAKGLIEISEIKSYIRVFFTDIKSILERDENYNPLITYVRPKEYLNPYVEDNTISILKYSKWISKNCIGLQKFGFNDYSILSVLKSKEFGEFENIISNDSSFLWGDLTIVNIGIINKTYLQAGSISPFNITELLSEIEIIKSSFRCYEWFNVKMKELVRVDDESYDLLDTDFSKLKAKKILSIYKEQEATKSLLLKLTNKTIDEVQDFTITTPFFSESEKYEQNKYDIPIKMSYGMNLINAPNSLLYLYSLELNSFYIKINSDIRRVSEKSKEITNYFHNKINIESIKTTRFHTKLMTFMTLVILAATLLALYISVISNINQIANVFI